MSGSDGQSKSNPVNANGPALLPPPAAADKSVLRSIAALDAAETHEPKHSHHFQKGRAVAVTVIESAVNEPASQTTEMQNRNVEEKFTKMPEAIKPLRANAFRPNEAASAAKPRRSAWFMRAAVIALTVGGGWLAASNVLPVQWPGSSGKDAIAKLSPVDQLRQELQQVSGELAAMRSQLSQFSSAETRSRQGAELDAVKKSLAEFSRRMEQMRAAQTAALTEVGARVDRARQDEAKYREDVVQRLTRLEREISDPAPTASTAPALSSNSTAVQRNAPPPPSEAAPQRKPSALSGYILREVYQGVALLEGRKGYLEVYPGSTIPGAGRVQSIVRRGGEWVVVTSTGVIGSRYESD